MKARRAVKKVDPIARFRRWFAAARRASSSLYDACALATADRRGRPSVRYVLLKEADSRGFVFFTNARSRKGRELRANPLASLVFYWNDLNRQVRVEGRVYEVDSAEADAYWATRPRESNLGAIASDQSAPLAGRARLLSAYRKVRLRYRGKAVPRPRWWTGFRIVPDSIEFWTRGKHRLHDRELFRRGSTSVTAKWKRSRIQP